MIRLATGLAVARAVTRRVRDARLTFLAAAVAYYAFVSVVPLLLLTVVVATSVGGASLADEVVAATRQFLAPAGEAAVRDALEETRAAAEITLVGAGLLLWSGLKLFRGLGAAFEQVYEAPATDGLVDQLRDAATVLVTVGAAAAAAVGLGALLPVLSSVPHAEVIGVLVLPGALTGAFLPLYYVFPDAPVTVREALPGAVGAAVGWTALAAGFQTYVALSGRDAAGVLGGVLLLVTWFYLAAIVIILGAVLNAVLASGRDDGGDESPDGTGESGDDEGRPAPDIVAMERELEALRERLEEKTVDRSALEADLKRYVRGRLRRGHARGWGPYLVLLYGTAMTLGAFYLLSGGWAILAMVVVWLSTLGLYALMLLVGAGLSAASAPGRLRDWLRARRS